MITLEQDSKEVYFHTWTFPGKEVGLKLAGKVKDVETWITLWMPDSQDLILYFNLLDALRVAGVSKYNISVRMPYVPYARQDRVCHEGESNALEIFSRMFRHMSYCREVIIDDPHSNVAIDDLSSMWYELKINRQSFCARDLPLYNTLIAPDKGAHNKASTHKQVCNKVADCVFLTKTRSALGVAYDDYKQDSLVGTACVVDDLCDGGATFLSVGKMLRATQPRLTKLDLYVTHGLFSKGDKDLHDVFDNVYCYNLYNNDALRVKVLGTSIPHEI